MIYIDSIRTINFYTAKRRYINLEYYPLFDN